MRDLVVSAAFAEKSGVRDVFHTVSKEYDPAGMSRNDFKDFNEA